MDDMCVGKQQAVLRDEHAAAEGEGVRFIIDTDDKRCRFLAGTVQIACRQSPGGPRSEQPRARQGADDGKSNDVAAMRPCECDSALDVTGALYTKQVSRKKLEEFHKENHSETRQTPDLATSATFLFNIRAHLRMGYEG